jgi:hypothetical protein
VEDREVRLAVLPDLDRHLGRGRCAAGTQRASAREREVVEPKALEVLDELGALVAEREQHAAIAGVVPLLELLRALALKRADQEVPAPVTRDDRAHRTPAIRVAQPGEHLRAGHEVREPREESLDGLGHARVRGNAPVLAPPVEPAPRKLLDGLVQVLVKRKGEDQLGLARVVVEQPDLAGGRRRLVLDRVSGQTDQLSWGSP